MCHHRARTRLLPSQGISNRDLLIPGLSFLHFVTFCKVQVYKISQCTREMLQPLFTLHDHFPTTWRMDQQSWGGASRYSFLLSAQGAALHDKEHPRCPPWQGCVCWESSRALSVLIEMLVASCSSTCSNPAPVPGRGMEQRGNWPLRQGGPGRAAVVLGCNLGCSSALFLKINLC